MTENEMAGWHHCLNGHEFETAPGDGEGQGGLVCRSPWGHKESDTTEQQLLFCVGLFVTLLSVARLAPLSMGFPKQEY